MKEFIGAYIEVIPSESREGVDLKFGWDFPDNMDPEMEDLLRNIVAGVFGLMSTQSDDVVALGEIVRSVSGFDDSIQSISDNEILFTPDEDLLDEIEKDTKDTKVIDIRTMKPKGEA